MAATAVATVVLSAAPAFVVGPATVTKSGTVLTLTAPPGTQHTIRIHEDATTITMRDLAGLRPAAGSGCISVPTGTSDIVCSKTGLTRVVVNAGDFDDTIGIGAAAGSTVTYAAFGGAGQRRVRTQRSAQHRTRRRGERRPGQHQPPVPGHPRRRHRHRPLCPRHDPRRPRRLRGHPVTGAIAAVLARTPSDVRGLLLTARSDRLVDFERRDVIDR